MKLPKNPNFRLLKVEVTFVTYVYADPNSEPELLNKFISKVNEKEISSGNVFEETNKFKFEVADPNEILPEVWKDSYPFIYGESLDSSADPSDDLTADQLLLFNEIRE